MSREDADAFYRAYKAGLQHVGEILRHSCTNPHYS